MNELTRLKKLRRLLGDLRGKQHLRMAHMQHNGILRARDIGFSHGDCPVVGCRQARKQTPESEASRASDNADVVTL